VRHQVTPETALSIQVVVVYILFRFDWTRSRAVSIRGIGGRGDRHAGALPQAHCDKFLQQPVCIFASIFQFYNQ
jgi:hypothetical protein